MANTKVTGDLIASSTIATGNIADNAVTSDKISGITTAHITEGSNLYYTNARSRGAISVSGNALSYNSSTGVITSNFEESPTFTGAVNITGDLDIGATDGNNAVMKLSANTGNWVFTNVQSSRNLEISDSDGTGTVMVINTSGNVGIGTTSPSSKLHINSSDTGLRIVGTTRSQILLENSTSAWQIESPTSSGNVPAGALGIIESGVGSRLTILTGGNVGIGVTSPAEKLHIRDASTNANVYIKIANDSRDWFMGVEGSNSDILSFKTHDASNLLNIASGGNVGIGTSSPAAKLFVRHNVANDWAGTFQNNSSNAYGLSIDCSTASAATFVLAAYSPNGSGMFLNGSGNVGIGTTTPMTTLHVQQSNGSYPDDANNHLVVESSSHSYIGIGGGTSSDVGIHFGDSGGINLGRIAYKNSDNSMRFNTNSGERMVIDSSGNLTVNNGNVQLVDSNKRITVDGSDIRIWQRSSANIQFLTNDLERMRITSGGRVLINNTNYSSDSICHIGGNSSNYALYLYADSIYSSNYRYQRFFSGGNIAGGIEGSNQTSVSYSTSSDYRMKKNIITLENGLDRVLKLKPVKFDWKLNNETTEGFIAHEVQEIFPYAVTGEKDGEDMQGMDYGRITPLLVKAIQEQQEIINDLKNRIQTLENN